MDNSLFFKIWRNVYLLNLIIKHLRIYNLVNQYTCKEYNMFCLKTLKLFKYPQYIKELNYHSESFQFNFEDNEIDENLFYSDLNLISEDDEDEDHGKKGRDIYGLSKLIELESLIIHSNDKLLKEFIPSSVTSLCLTTEFNQDLVIEESIPNNIKSLSIQTIDYNKLIKSSSSSSPSSSSLVSLSFGIQSLGEYKEKQDGNYGIIPNGIEYLNFGNFNSPLLDSSTLLPNSIKILEFYSFNSKIEILPSSLEKLIFNREFNQDLSNINLPNTLLYLDLGNDFNTLIKPNSLPPNLKSIIFGDAYDKPILENVLPKSIESISFGHFFSQSIEEINFQNLPNLKVLEFYSIEHHNKNQPHLLDILKPTIKIKEVNNKITTYYGI